jgi:predicted amidohydrolase YtcJ
MALAGPKTKVVDLKGRRVLPGLIDNHLHIIRGGLNFNMELRWDGVCSLVDAMAMLKRQVAVTPPPQWVRVVGGFTAHQFEEKRLPTIEEINAVAPDTPVFLLHLYDRALLNAAALRAVGYTKDTPNPPGGEIVRGPDGTPTGLLLARPNAGILYATLAKGPKLPFDYQLNSTRHFMRELNRLGVTGAIDAGGGFQNYPDDYAVIEKLAAEGQLTIRLAYNLFTQKPKGEKEDFLRWTRSSKYRQGDDYFRHNGAGEMLVFSAADFEDFREPRPDMPPEMEPELEAVVRILAQNRWPWRLHATYDETISRALDVFERVNQDMPLDGLHWFFDHAETPKQSRSSPSTGSRRWAAASPCSTAWPIRGNTSLNVTGQVRPKPRRRSHACWRRASSSPPAPMRRGSPPTIRGCRSPGWSPGARSEACASIRNATA